MLRAFLLVFIAAPLTASAGWAHASREANALQAGESLTKRASQLTTMQKRARKETNQLKRTRRIPPVRKIRFRVPTPHSATEKALVHEQHLTVPKWTPGVTLRMESHSTWMPTLRPGPRLSRSLAFAMRPSGVLTSDHVRLADIRPGTAPWRSWIIR